MSTGLPDAGTVATPLDALSNGALASDAPIADAGAGAVPRRAVPVNLPAGPQLATFEGDTLVPDGVPATSGQISVSQFSRSLGGTLVDRVCGTGAEYCVRLGASTPVAAGMLADILKRTIDANAGLEGPDAWLRRKFGVPGGLTPDELITAVADAVRPEQVVALLDEIEGVDAEDQDLRWIEDPDDTAYIAVAAGLVPTEAAEIGKLVHLTIQQDYLDTHPDHNVLVESRMYFTGVLRGLVGTLRSIVRANPNASPLLKALLTGLVGQTSWATKRPDILDLDTREIWEIKPRSASAIAIEEIRDYYLAPLNAAFDAAGLPAIRPGTSWPARPLYPIPPAAPVMYANVTLAPGAILYTISRPVTIPEPERVVEPAKDAIKLLLIILLAVLAAFLPEILPVVVPAVA